MNVEEKVFIKADDIYIYEKDGEIIYRRKFMDYDNREEISIETIKATELNEKETDQRKAEKQKKIWEHTKRLSAESLKMQQEEFKQWDKKA